MKNVNFWGALLGTEMYLNIIYPTLIRLYISLLENLANRNFNKIPERDWSSDRRIIRLLSAFYQRNSIVFLALFQVKS